MSFAWPGRELNFFVLNCGLAAIEFLVKWAHLIPPCHRIFEDNGDVFGHRAKLVPVTCPHERVHF